MELTRHGDRRVVVTGMGALTALGEIPEVREALREGRSGVDRIQAFDPVDLNVQIASEVTDFDPEEYGVPYKEARRMARSSQFSVAGAKMALADAGLSAEDMEHEAERVGVVVGSGLAGYHRAIEAVDGWRESGKRRADPFALTAAIPNMPVFYVAREAGAKGRTLNLSAACATGTACIGMGAEMVQENKADVMIAGGVEAMIFDYAVMGFDAMRVLTRDYNDRPKEAMRPFDKDRSGFVYGEGVSLLVLESLEHALARDARIYAEVLGYSWATELYHTAIPDPEVEGPVRALRWALEDAHIAPEDVDYINAHGPGTEVNDPLETLAVKRVFGDHAYKLAMSSTKSMLGHLMGAAGAIETAACVMMLDEGVMHPTVNLENPDPECDLDYVPNVAREADIDIAINENFGLGGNNACVVLKKYK